MMALFLLAQAASTAIGQPTPATDTPSGRWANLRIEAALGESRTEIAIGTSRYDRDRKQLDYWMRREERDRQGDSLKVS